MKLSKEEIQLMRLVRDFKSQYNVEYLTEKPFFEYMRMAFVMGMNHRQNNAPQNLSYSGKVYKTGANDEIYKIIN